MREKIEKIIFDTIVQDHNLYGINLEKLRILSTKVEKNVLKELDKNDSLNNNLINFVENIKTPCTFTDELKQSILDEIQ